MQEGKGEGCSAVLLLQKRGREYGPKEREGRRTKCGFWPSPQTMTRAGPGKPGSTTMISAEVAHLIICVYLFVRDLRGSKIGSKGNS